MCVLLDVMVSDGKISELEEKLLEASEEMMTLRAERRKVVSGRVEGNGHCQNQCRL